MLEKLRGRKPALIDYEKYRRSAVVIPLIKKQEGYEVLFEVRDGCTDGYFSAAFEYDPVSFFGGA